jgi:heme/copper-type cytochrome/quinol oxidase subunit 2
LAQAFVFLTILAVSTLFTVLVAVLFFIVFLFAGTSTPRKADSEQSHTDSAKECSTVVPVIRLSHASGTDVATT